MTDRIFEPPGARIGIQKGMRISIFVAALCALFLLSVVDAPVVTAKRAKKDKREKVEREARPYLYFTPDTLGDFRSKLKREPFASRWGRLIGVANDFAARPLSDKKVVGGDRARPAEGLIEVLSLAYAVTGEKRYGERAKAETWALLAQDAWHEPKSWNKGAELPTAECSMACARFYDWCNDLLNEEDRKYFRERALELGLKPYLASIEQYRPARTDLWVDNYVTNWCGVCHGGGGLLGLALYDELPEAKKAADYAWKYLPEFLDHVILEDGAGHEGVMYWRYGVAYAFMFVTAWEHVMGEELPFETSERFTGYWDVYMHGPDQTYANFNDMNEDTFSGLWSENPKQWEGGPSGALNALFESRCEDGDPLLLWAADNGGGGAFNNGISPDWFLWRRDTGPAGEKPEMQRNVLFRGAGHAILSSDKLWLAYNGGWISDKSHANNDLGTFVLVSDGERFIHDPGYNKNETSQHSTITIDGESQPKASQAKFKGFFEGKKFAWFMSDLGECYGGKTRRAERSVIMVDGKYVVILDDIETTGTDDIDLRFQSKLPIKTTDTGAVLTGKTGKLHVVVAEPAVKVATGDTSGAVKHVSLRAENPGSDTTFVTVLFPGAEPRVDWKVKGGKGTLTVNGDKHEFSNTSAGWVPTKIDGEKVPKPEAPEDRVIK
ncbi:MAG: heparinase II/III family protein [Planctomycetes bacterium]|nr:heparinase II/III family protein [Planctomycetota bacterium]